jgi:alpha-beta hydrolase superfamily lysophospholipase
MRNYETEIYWKQYQPFFPTSLRVSSENQPDEEWFAWRGASIHIDRFPCTSSAFTVIVVHGAGGYGRLLAPIGRLLHDAGYEVVAPDLPGYGLSQVDASLMTYQAWLAFLCDLVENEKRTFDRPIVLCGGSLGGYLAYLCAARAPRGQISGLVATTLADPRLPLVKQQFARNSAVLAMMPLLPLVNPLIGRLRLPIKWFTKMEAISNNSELSQLMSADPCGGARGFPSTSSSRSLTCDLTSNPNISTNVRFFSRIPRRTVGLA